MVRTIDVLVGFLEVAHTLHNDMVQFGVSFIEPAPKLHNAMVQFRCSFIETAPKLHHVMVQFRCSFNETAPKLHRHMVQFGGLVGAVWLQFVVQFGVSGGGNCTIGNHRFVLNSSSQPHEPHRLWSHTHTNKPMIPARLNIATSQILCAFRSNLV